MTYHAKEPFGYVLGTCAQIADDGSSIWFEPIKGKKFPDENAFNGAREFSLEDVRRYDTNWY